jgi:alkanesulfonate monooxygenase SsuD/methylene tetrahydromethanopterin reductase-like flavin-dependent oxidoreductase (luciferase family)
MKFSSFHLFHQHQGWSEKEVYDYNVELVEYLEEVGFDGVWLAEHHFRDYGLCNNIPAMLSFLAARTRRMRLGTGVSILPLHNPVLVAEEIAQLDVLSGGRVDFGIGRGYQSSEFSRFGIDISEARERYDEALELILKLWREDNVEFDGRFYKAGGVTLKPRPLQRPHPPVYVASVSPDTLKLCARRGMPFMADGASTFGGVSRAAATWRDEMAANGFDTADHDLVVMRSVYVGTSNDEAREALSRFEMGFDRARIINAASAPIDPKTGQIAKGYEFWQDRYLKGGTVTDEFRWDHLEVIGDAERVIGQIRRLQEAGFTNIMCDFGSTRPMPIKEMKAIVKRFADEVIPAFR